jgi:hypothetical protein
MLAEFRSGYTTLADGTVAPSRASRLGAGITGEGQGRYYEATSRGTVFSAGITAWTSTVASGNVIGAAGSGYTQFAVWNPTGSGKNLSLLKFGVYPISGTAPIPAIWHSATTTAPSIATSVAATYGWFSCNNTGMAVASVARVLASQAGAILTGTSTLTIIRAADLYITAGTAANLAGAKVIEYIDGDIVIPPGTGWIPTWAAVGTTFLGGYSITWEEIPV